MSNHENPYSLKNVLRDAQIYQNTKTNCYQMFIKQAKTNERIHINENIPMTI